PMRNKLRSSLAGVAFSFAASGSSFAQAPPSAPVYNWTGFYVGVNAGASFGSVKTDFNGAPIFAASPPQAAVAITPGFAFSDREYPSGFIGGGQIGYNWQFSPIWVVGLEADIQGALERSDTDTITQTFTFGRSGENQPSCGLPPQFPPC